MLWSLTPPKGEVSYLFGTMHVRDDRAHQFAEGLYPLIRNADVFVGEMDLNAPLTQPDIPTYDILQYLSLKKYNKLKEQVRKSFAVELDYIAHLHPLMIMSMLSTSSLQTEHHISLDEHLWEYAHQNGIPVSGLESYQEQFNLLHSIDPALIYKQLIEMSRRPASIKISTNKSIDLYVEGDIHHLYMMSKSSMQQLRKKLIYRRNENMAAVISRLDPTKKYFVTVGAGHLSGWYGLIRLLKKRGFSLKPITEMHIRG